MNLNSIRTMLSIAALVVLGLGVAAGCTVDQVSGVIKECTNSWLPVAVSAKVSMGLMAINQFLKGFQGGSFLDGLFKRQWLSVSLVKLALSDWPASKLQVSKC
jgi:hypothetical protein